MKGIGMLVLLGLFGAAACGGRNAQPVQEEPNEPTPPPPQGEEEGKMTLEGTLAPTVEAGGWVLNTEKKLYLLIFDRKYLKEDWFREGAWVRVVGKESPDTVTIFMQGTPFRVEKMEPR